MQHNEANVVGTSCCKKREVGKFEVRKKHLSWKVPIEVGKLSMPYLSNQKFSNFRSNFPTSFFPISFRTFKL